MATIFSPPAQGYGVVSPDAFPPALTQMLEHVECAAWRDLYRAASSEDAVACGVYLDDFGGATVMAASSIDVLFFNRVMGLGIGTPAIEDVLDQLAVQYLAWGVPRFFVQVSPAAVPPILFDWLQRHGFRHYNNWVKLFRGVEPPPEVQTTLHVEPIEPEHAATFARIAAPAFDWPAITQPWLARLVGRPGWRHYQVLDGNVPVAIGAMFVRGDHGYLGPAVTLPAHRGRGAQSALLARRIRDAARLGCSWLVMETVEPTPERPVASYRNARRFGFAVAYARPNYIFEQHPA